MPRIREVQRAVPDTPFLLENSVWYVPLEANELTEAAFLNQLCAESGAGLLLDLHNLYTNGRNGLSDPERFLDELDLDQVREIHVAGGMELDGFYLDAHSGTVPEPVWRLLAGCCRAVDGWRAWCSRSSGRGSPSSARQRWGASWRGCALCCLCYRFFFFFCGEPEGFQTALARLVTDGGDPSDPSDRTLAGVGI